MTRIYSPPNFKDLSAGFSPARMLELISMPIQEQDYLHWSRLRYKQPPQGLTPEEWWFVLKFRRSAQYRAISHHDKQGRAFVYTEPDSVRARLHELDFKMRQRLADESQDTASYSGQRYLIDTLMGEAITSSQLEGALTTREVAKEMLKQGRRPQDHSQMMIVNNYQAMEFVYQARTERLTPQLVFEIHRIITEGTLEQAQYAGRLRDTDDIAVYKRDGIKTHHPPPAAELKQRLDSLCDFANQETGFFLHPLIHAIIIHFLLGYDHPFVDGNGRTARALFYWFLLKSRYDVARYISISRLLRDAPVQYGDAFRKAETDDGDMTYFIIHQLDVVAQAIQDMRGYMDKKQYDETEIIKRLRGHYVLNHRQRAVLGRAIRKPYAIFSIKSHQRSHDVVYQTARTDLLELARYGLLEQHKSGNEFIFQPAYNLKRKLQHPGRATAVAY